MNKKLKSLAISLISALLLLGGALALLSSATTVALSSAAQHSSPLTTIITENISTDTTWTLPGSPYQLEANVVVLQDVTLTIEPGVEVRAQGNVGLDVAGTLYAVGTAGQPITFTATNAQPGAWQGLRIYGAAGQPNTGSVLEHVTVEYGGALLRHNLWLEWADVILAHSRVRESSRDGLYAEDSTATLSQTVFSANAGYGVLFERPAGPLPAAGLSAYGNGHDGLALKNATLEGEHTWRPAGIPYLLVSVPGADAVRVTSASTLTIAPGVEVRSQSARLHIEGTLKAIGTAAQPITFTAAVTNPAPGAWRGIRIEGTAEQPNTGSALEYVTIAYGGLDATHNLHLRWAEATVRHSTLRHSAGQGLYGEDSGATVQATHFTGNQDYAAYFTRLHGGLNLAHLTADANGTDGVALHTSDLSGEHTWDSGLPYHLLGPIHVLPGSSLAIKPGVTVYAHNNLIRVGGMLHATGAAQQPITFTAPTPAPGSTVTTPEPGSWRGLHIYGTAAQPNVGSVLEHVILEYGGGERGNLSLEHAQVRIAHSILRHSSKDGLHARYAGGTVIERSQIVGNAEFGVQNWVGQQLILAPHNWWGGAGGPAHAGGCNAGGTGDRVSDRVAFRPFLTSADAVPAPLAPGEARLLTLEPLRWFAPADGVARIYVRITLRDGNGQPLPGRTVRLTSSLGQVVDGGVTDVQGQTLAYVTSNVSGEAELLASLDLAETCELATGATARVTFTDTPDDPLLGEAESPYMNSGISIAPLPLAVGKPVTVSVELVNPNDFPIAVDVTFGIAQLGIGLVFGPIGEVAGVRIEAESSAVVSVPWTPLVPGHVCVEVLYTATPIARISTQKVAWQGSGRGQHNYNVGGGTLSAEEEQFWMDQYLKHYNQFSDAQLLADLVSSPKQGFVKFCDPRGHLFSYILENTIRLFKEAAQAISDPEAYGRRQRQWDYRAMLQAQDPRPDYTIYATPERMTAPLLEPGEHLTSEMAEAANVWMSDGLEMIAQMRAALISMERYGDATEAGDQHWAAQQAAAYLYYKRQAATAMADFADHFEAYLQLLYDAGVHQAVVTPEAYAAYQERLRDEGFDESEQEVHALLGISAEEAEAFRQQVLDADPEAASGDIIAPLGEIAGALRGWAEAILDAQHFPPAAEAALLATTSDNQLARVSATRAGFLVGNPLTQTAVIELRVRPVALPDTWAATVTPVTVTLSPGEYITASVTLWPAGISVQSTYARVAVEGYVGETLIGGVTQDVFVPARGVFEGHDLRYIYLPLALRTSP